MKQPIAIGNRGIQLQSMDELYRFSKYVEASGLAPKGMEKVESVFVAIQMGMEVGLTPMAALQNIAVINGRPTIWGDAQLAIVRSTGELEEFSEWYESGGVKTTRNPTTFADDTCAVCRVKRRGFEVQESAFSVADAKRAGLWGKAGPWTQYPARLLRFRARSFNLRDNFGDALRGMLTAEEAIDIGPVVDVVEVKKTESLPVFQPRESKKQRQPAPEPPKQEVAPANQQRRKHLEEILASENANFDTLLFVCTDQKDGFTNWAHHVSGHDSLDAIPDESIEFFVDKEKQLRMFLKSAVGLGKGIQTA